jgi:bifunctional DNA-binding transcriptional regulator/antitoxin component of YhaV-PrlF toxin-antitoxin module
MSKVTSKLQVTLPKVLAAQFGIEPGDEIHWEAASDVIRVVPAGRRASPDVKARVHVFDKATARQRKRQRTRGRRLPADRGWTREELYERGRAR